MDHEGMNFAFLPGETGMTKTQLGPFGWGMWGLDLGIGYNK